MFNRDQAYAFHWQRYRTRWPTVKCNMVPCSKSTRTIYYWRTVDGIDAPPGWGWFLEGDRSALALCPIQGHTFMAITRGDFPAQ